MWNPYSSWLMLGLGCALSLANGGRRSAMHRGEIVTWSNLRNTTRWRENWPEAITEMVVIALIVSGAESLNRHGVGWWMFPLALVCLALLPAIPALIHNARVTGRIVLPRTVPPAKSAQDSGTPDKVQSSSV